MDQQIVIKKSLINVDFTPNNLDEWILGFDKYKKLVPEMNLFIEKITTSARLNKDMLLDILDTLRNEENLRITLLSYSLFDLNNENSLANIELYKDLIRNVINTARSSLSLKAVVKLNSNAETLKSWLKNDVNYDKNKILLKLTPQPESSSQVISSDGANEYLKLFPLKMMCQNFRQKIISEYKNNPQVNFLPSLENILVYNLETYLKLLPSEAKIHGFNNIIDLQVYNSTSILLRIPLKDYIKLVNFSKNVLVNFSSKMKQKITFNKDNFELLKDIKLNFSLEQAKKIILASSSFLGEQYVNVLNAILENVSIIESNQSKNLASLSTSLKGQYVPFIEMQWDNSIVSLIKLTIEISKLVVQSINKENNSFALTDESSSLYSINSIIHTNLLFDHLINSDELIDSRKLLINYQFVNWISSIGRSTSIFDFKNELFKMIEDQKQLTPSIILDLVDKTFCSFLELDKDWIFDDFICSPRLSNGQNIAIIDWMMAYFLYKNLKQTKPNDFSTQLNNEFILNSIPELLNNELYADLVKDLNEFTIN